MACWLAELSLDPKSLREHREGLESIGTQDPDRRLERDLYKFEVQEMPGWMRWTIALLAIGFAIIYIRISLFVGRLRTYAIFRAHQTASF